MSKFYKNQIETAQQIAISTKRYNILSAQMQSGKTGAAFFWALTLLFTGKVDRIFILSGTSDTELKDQWIAEYTSTNKGEAKKKRNLLDYFIKHHRPTDNALAHIDDIDIKEYVQDRINIHFQTKINAIEAQMFKKCAVILDESHYGLNFESTLDKAFDDLDIHPCLQGDETALAEKNIHLLSVSATSAAEIDSNEKKDDTDPTKKPIFRLLPGDDYRGVKHFMDNSHIKEGFVLSKDKPIPDEMIQVLEQYHETYPNSYVVIRATGNHDSAIRNMCSRLGIGYELYDRNSKDKINLFKEKPKVLTVIHIKGMLRMGKVLPKDYICAVMETSSDPKDDTCLQGLLGRCCGYHNYDIDIYLPKRFIDKSVSNYINFTNGNGHLDNMMNVPRVSSRMRNLENFTVPTHLETDIPVPGNDREAQDSRDTALRHILDNSSCLSHHTYKQQSEILEHIDRILGDWDQYQDEVSYTRIHSNEVQSGYRVNEENLRNKYPSPFSHQGKFLVSFVTVSIEGLPLHKEGHIWFFAKTDAKTVIIPNTRPCPFNTGRNGMERPIEEGEFMTTIPQEASINPEILKSFIICAIRMSEHSGIRQLNKVRINKEIFRKGASFDRTNNKIQDIIGEINRDMGVTMKAIVGQGKQAVIEQRYSKITW
jgi:hypothetical protein